MNSNYFIIKGRSHMSKDIERAFEYFRLAEEKDPKNSAVFLNRGDAFQIQGKYDEALTCYEEALKIDRALPTGYNNIGL